MMCKKNPALTSTEKINLLKKKVLQPLPPDNEMVAPLEIPERGKFTRRAPWTVDIQETLCLCLER